MSERFVIPVDGCDLVGERWAGPPGGELVVLLHEGVSDRRGWREVASILAAQASVVSYDRRGFGESAVSGVPHPPQIRIVSISVPPLTEAELAEGYKEL